MTTDVRTIITRLKADTSAYTTTMRKAATDTKKVGESQEAAQRSASKWKAVGTAAQLGGAALAAGLLATAKAASNQEQALGSLNAVFKVNGSQMEANAKGATKIGLSTTAYAEAAAKLGAQLGNLGVDQSELGGTTDDLMNKAADLAAMFGGTTQEAVDALGAAMRGEADPAERYGLALNATAVNAEMAATGADKAHAMMALLNKQMAKSGAAGAAAREYDSVAAATQRMQAEFDNASADLGRALLPALTKAADAAAGLLQKFNDLPEGARTATTAVAALSAAVMLALPYVVRMADAMAKMKESGGALGGLSTAATKLAAVGGAIAGAEAFITAITTLTEKAGKVTGLVNEFAALKDTIIGLTPGVGVLVQFGGIFQQLIDKIGIFGESGSALGAAWSWLTQESDAAKAGITGAANATASAAAASDKDAEAKTREADATNKAAAAYEKYMQAVQQALSLMSAKDALIGQEDRLAAAIRKNGSALKGRTSAAAANREAMGQEVTKITDLVQATYDETGSVKAAERARRQHVKQLLASADAAGYDRNQTRSLLKQLGLFKPISTSVTVSGLDAANRQASQLQRTLAGISGMAIVGGNPGSFGSNLWGHASGGYISGPGGPTSDSIPAMLSNGEYVMRASAVKRLGVGRLDAMNYARGGLVGYAAGGVVGYARGGQVQMPGVGRTTRDAEKALDKWRKRLKDAREAVKDLKRQAADYHKSIKDNVLGSLKALDAFDFSKHSSATSALADSRKRLADATRAYRDAQVAANTAAPGDRAAAAKALADAERDLAAARGDVAAAQKEEAATAPTPANILKAIQAQAKAAQDYTKSILTLKKRGLSRDLIDQLAGTDPAAAKDMLDALNQMSDKQLAAVMAAEKAKKAAAEKLAGRLDNQYNAPIKAAQKAAKKAAKHHPESVRMALADRAAATTSERLAEARERNGRSLDRSTKRGKANRVALRDEVKLAYTAAQETYRRVKATKGESAAQSAANRVLQQHRRDLLNGASAAGYSRTEVSKYVGQLGLVPKSAAVDFSAPGLESMTLDVDELGTLIRDVPTDAETAFATSGKDSTKSDVDEVKSKYDTLPASKSTSLSAAQSSDIGTVVAATLTYLDNQYGNKQRNAGLSGENRGLNPAISDALGYLDDNYTGRQRNAGLGGESRGLGAAAGTALGYLVANYASKQKNAGLGGESRGLGAAAGTALGYLVANYASKQKNAGLGGESRGLGAAAGTALGYLVANYASKQKNAGLGAAAVGLGAATGAALGYVEKNYGNKRRNMTLGAVADTRSGRQAAYDVAMAGYQAMQGSGLQKFYKVPKPAKSDFGLAKGGYITGPGTGTSDSIPAMLSNGEYVIRAASVAKYGTDLMDALNTGTVTGPRSTLTAATATPIAGASRVNVAVTASPIPIIIKMNDRTVATSQLKLRRQTGGTITVGA